MMLDLFLSRLVVLPKKASNCAGRCFSCLSKQRQKKPSHHANQEGAGIETQHVQQLLNTSRNTTCPTTYKQLFSQPCPCFSQIWKNSNIPYVCILYLNRVHISTLVLSVNGPLKGHYFTCTSTI